MSEDLDTPLYAINLRQPYAELVLQGILKDDQRSEPSPFRGRVYIYASRKFADGKALWKATRVDKKDLPTAVIVGTVELVGCREDKRRGCYVYRYEHPVRFEKPIKTQGRPASPLWIPEIKHSHQDE